MPHHGEKHHGEPSLILTGSVSYRFHLRQSQQPSKSGASPSRKRARRDGKPPGDGDEDTNHDDDPFLADPDASIVGFVLHDEARSEDYLLSAPQHLQRLLGQAAAGHLRVRVSADNVVDMGRPSTTRHDEETAGGVCGFVETSSLQILSTDNVSDFEDGPRSFLSLAQVRRAEAMDNVIGSTTKRWDVRATVRAVSPILTADPADPYCLVELLDADALGSGVAILRQHALVHHASIVPGQTLFLRQARRRAWNVHETLPPAADAPPQLPSKVLLVDQPDQIVWPSSASPRTVGDAFNEQPDGEACPTTVSGEVARIRTVKVRKDDKSPITEHLHTIELVGSAADPSTSHHSTLFVTYFPLPTGLLLSIRQGARILATNVRPMTLAGSNCYCATLRSHLSLLSHGPRSPGAAARRFTSTEIAMAMHPCRPPPARLSYEELWARRAVAPMLDPWLAPLVNKGTLLCPTRPQCPDPKDVADAYLRSTGTVLDKQRMSGAAQRDTNAEFFFGDCEGFHPFPFRPGNDSDRPASCASPEAVPVVRVPMKVEDVYNSAIQALNEVLDSHVKSRSCSFGCMGSIHRTGRDLLTNGDCVGDSARPVVFGLASSAMNSAGPLQAVVSSPGGVSIPCALRLPTKWTHGKFLFATVESFIASFLSLGACESSNNPHPIGGYQLRNPGANSDFYGTCQILVVHDVAFLVSLRLECTNGFVFDSDRCNEGWDINKVPISLMTDSRSIQECLADPLPSESKFFSGLLACKLLRVFKATSGSYKGCTLSLAHLPSDVQDLRVDSVSTVQSSDLKLAIPVDDSMLIQLRRRLASTARLGLLDRQLVVACIWWQIALQAQLLLDGGWDELVSSGSAVAEATGVVVMAPVSAVQLDPARGYVRLACQLGDLTLSSIQLRPCLAPSVGGARRTAPSLDFLGKKRILPGDLSSRAKRRLGSSAQRGQYSFGELYHPVSKFAGIPCCAIADLFRDLMADLASKSRSRLAPSLVREMRSAKLLSVSYCQVVAECPSCFKSLVAPGSGPDLGGGVSGNGGTSLRCPGQCPTGGCASVKWECSGTLDDGTGQAKLYAEREAALALLGMSATGVRDVEAAALSRPGGLVYSRGLPPRPDLVVALDAARHRSLQKLHDEWSMERQQHQRRAPRARITEGDLLNCLSVYDRGDLVLQRHCRCSREPTRDLVYYVRCKPVSDEVLQRGILGLSDIDVLRPGVGGGRATVSKHVATYTLPPLKLVLVDVASPSHPFYGDSAGA